MTYKGSYLVGGLAKPIPTHGSGSAKVWRPGTPEMACVMDQSHVEFERGAEVPRTAVAPTADGLSNGTR